MDRTSEAFQMRDAYHRAVAENEEEFVINALRPRQGRVLEVGPGTGRITRHLAKLAESLTVCDIRQEALENVALRLGSNARVTYHTLALEELERLPDFGRFDAAVAVRVVPHATDWRGALERLFNAVRPGGLVIFDLWNRESFVGALMKAFRRVEPVAVHRLTRREIRDATSHLSGKQLATYRWGYPRVGPVHLDDLGSVFFPSWAYSTLFCFQRFESERD